MTPQQIESLLGDYDIHFVDADSSARDLVPLFGFHRAAEIAKYCLKRNRPFVVVYSERGLDDASVYVEGKRLPDRL